MIQRGPLVLVYSKEKLHCGKQLIWQPSARQYYCPACHHTEKIDMTAEERVERFMSSIAPA